MARTSKLKVFNTFEEYKQFYALDKSEQSPKKEDRYYKIGEEVAKMACTKASNDIASNNEKYRLI